MFLGPGQKMRTSYASAASRAFVRGTVYLFWQTSAPLYWTRVTTQNDKMLRVVSATGGVSGGTNAFTTVFAQTVVGNTTITEAQLAAHSHGGVTGSSPVLYDLNAGATLSATGPFGVSSNQTHTHPISSDGSNSAHNHSITMAIQYIDIILASKN
jgi:hypothetical protein